jgi:FkbM family methyltransferase
LHACALGRSEGVATLVSVDANKGENHVETGSVSISGLSVPQTSLPVWIRAQNISRINALKIDIEGHEFDVLDSLFTNTPQSVWPRLVICEDVHDGDDRLARLLNSHGYTVTARGRLNSIYRFSA